MAIFYSTENLPSFHNAVVTVGTFDGVHRGHRAILSEVVKHAGHIRGESVLLTFEPHPRKLLFPDQPLGIITPLQQKLELISAAGIDHVVVVPFTREFASLSADEYIRHFMVGKFHPHSIIIGYDHRFGHDRKGDIRLLEDYASEFGYELVEIPAQMIDAATVSSTKIRHAILEGRMEDVTQMLGREYALTGTVRHGNKLGRTLGYPTANMQPADADQIVPAMGIYAIRCACGNGLFNGMLSIGINPTVTDTTNIKIEANLFDFDQDVYDQEITIYFVSKLRDEQKFASLEELTEQLHADKTASLQILTSSSAQGTQGSDQNG